jgi:hypothetical protein
VTPKKETPVVTPSLVKPKATPEAKNGKPELNQPLAVSNRKGSKFDLQGQENAVLYRVRNHFK